METHGLRKRLTFLVFHSCDHLHFNGGIPTVESFLFPATVKHRSVSTRTRSLRRPEPSRGRGSPRKLGDVYHHIHVILYIYYNIIISYIYIMHASYMYTYIVDIHRLFIYIYINYRYKDYDILCTQ